MNRTIALFLALAVLLAHVLAIYTTQSGSIGPPWDVAHVAFRMARNLVQNGVLAWNPDMPAVESYPSLLWIAISAVGERLYLPVTLFAQTVGIVAALATVLVLSKFSPTRLAGVIAPVLFVVSGPLAAAAASGTELALAGLLLTIAFLCVERGWPWRAAIAMALTVFVRTEGVVFCAALFVLELAQALRGRSSRARLLSFLGPLIALGVATLVRHQEFGSYFSPTMAELFRFDRERVSSGLWTLRDFLVSSGGPVLLAVPLAYAATGSLSGLGYRALFLALVWSALVAWEGGAALPFSAQMVPILAIWFVAVQEGMTVALDSKLRGLPEVAWALFLVGIAASAIASKYPGDIGPIRFVEQHRAWMEPRAAGPFGYLRPLGRLGLAEELDATRELRQLGGFLRDQIDPAETVLTPWPGAVGYLSRLRVFDVLGRTNVAPGEPELRSWTAMPRIDVSAALAERPGYILPSLSGTRAAPTMQEIATAWAKHLDIYPEDVDRSLAIRDQLRDYELVTLALGTGIGTGIDRCYLLRRRDLDFSPRLAAERLGSRVRVGVSHRAHQQLVDLRVQLIDRDNRFWSVRPDGSIAPTSDALLRTSILLFPTGERRVLLAEFDLPSMHSFTHMRAELRNPGASGEGLFSDASTELSIPIGP